MVLSGSYAAEVAKDSHHDTKTKHEQAYQCGTKRVLTYFFESTSATEARDEADRFASTLWDPGRSLEGGFEDELLTKDREVVLLSGEGAADLAGLLAREGWMRLRPDAGPAHPGR